VRAFCFMFARGDVQTPLFMVRVPLFLLFAIGHHILVVNSLPGRPVDLVELETAGGGCRGVDFYPETDQREGDLSGPVSACHKLFGCVPATSETWSFRPGLVL
jgi:hypothetical protein